MGHMVAPTVHCHQLDGALSTFFAKMGSTNTVNLQIQTPMGINLTTSLNPQHYNNNHAIKSYIEKVSKTGFIPIREIKFSLHPNHNNTYISISNSDGVLSKVVTSNLVQYKDDAGDLMLALKEAFDVQEARILLSTLLPHELGNTFRAYNTAVDQFGEQTANLGRTLTKIVEENQTQIHRITAETKESFDKREAELRAEIEAERAKLKKREEEHEQKLKLIEDRESKHVRRDLLTKMQEALKSRATVTLSDKTIEKREAIAKACLWAGAVGVLFVVIGAVLAGYQIYNGHQLSYTPVAPITGGGLVIASTIVYYIKWSDQWFRRHADAEFANIQFENDILRANWLAELLFEWDSQQEKKQANTKEGVQVEKVDFPQQLVERFSVRLFHPPSSRSPDHPSEAIVKIMNEAKSIKVGKGAFEVTRSKDDV